MHIKDKVQNNISILLVSDTLTCYLTFSVFLLKQKEYRLTTAVLVPMKILKNDDDNVLYVVGVVAKEAVGDKELAVEGVSVICPLVN